MSEVRKLKEWLTHVESRKVGDGRVIQHNVLTGPAVHDFFQSKLLCIIFFLNSTLLD